jgi:hypothetical protein
MKAIILTAIAVSLLICALVFPMEKQQSASASKYIHTPGDLDMKYIHQLGYKVGYNDGVTEGIYHHVYDDFNNTSWSSGYLDGFVDGCVHTGRSVDECNSQTDASTP